MPELEVAPEAPVEAVAEPAEAPVAGPEYEDRFDRIEQGLGILMQQQLAAGEQQYAAPQPQAGPELPEWNPWDPDVVQAYQAHWVSEALAPILGPVLQDSQRASEMIHVERGQQVARQQYDQATEALVDAPEFVKGQFTGDNRPVLEDLALRIAAPYLSQGYAPEDVYGQVTHDVAQLLEQTGKAAVDAYRASLAGAAGAVAEPAAGLGAGQPIGGPTQFAGESAYRAAARAALDRMQPTVPA